MPWHPTARVGRAAVSACRPSTGKVTRRQVPRTGARPTARPQAPREGGGHEGPSRREPGRRTRELRPPLHG
eukprot:485274-Alexandrium_andersonii.AAC.1